MGLTRTTSNLHALLLWASETVPFKVVFMLGLGTPCRGSFVLPPKNTTVCKPMWARISQIPVLATVMTMPNKMLALVSAPNACLNEAMNEESSLAPENALKKPRESSMGLAEKRKREREKFYTTMNFFPLHLSFSASLSERDLEVCWNTSHRRRK